MEASRPSVLHVSKLYWPWIGGVERVVQDIAEGVAGEFISRVLVCEPRGSAEAGWVNGVEVIRAASVGMFLSMPVSLSFPLLFRKLATRADIVHMHLPFPLATMAWRRRARTGLIVTYHSDIVRQQWLFPLYGPLLKRVLHDADVILVSSPILIQRSTWLRPHAHKCRVVPLFVDLRDYPIHLDGVTEARELDFQSGMQFVLFVGRLVYYKGLEYLIRAMQHVDATLVIVGDGPLRKELERLSRELRVDHKVRFAGRVPTETLHKYYRACLCLVLPSVERSEAFGVVQLEAMAYGKPVVNTSLPTGVPFVSVHGETGLTVPPRDPSALAEALNRLCREEELRRRLGRQARKRVETMFSKDVILTQIKSIYRELLRQRPRGREMCRCAACQSG